MIENLMIESFRIAAKPIAFNFDYIKSKMYFIEWKTRFTGQKSADRRLTENRGSTVLKSY